MTDIEKLAERINDRVLDQVEHFHDEVLFEAYIEASKGMSPVNRAALAEALGVND